MKITDFYKSILEFGGLKVEPDGFVYSVFDKNKQSITVDGKRLAIPLDTHLRNPTNDKVMFHPLSENILRGKSEVIAKLLQVYNVRLNVVMSSVMQNVLSTAASPALHANLPPEFTEYIIACPDIDATAVKHFTSVMLAGAKKGVGELFVRIFLSRGGSINGKRYGRTAIVTFPFFEELLKEENTIFGVKVRVKDKMIYRKLLEAIFPGLEVKDSYSRGSDSSLAPFLDALLQSAAAISGGLSNVLEAGYGVVDGFAELRFESEWIESATNIDLYRNESRMIPAQPGNEGSMTTAENKAAQVPAIQHVPQPVPQPVNQVQQPVQQIAQHPTPYHPQYGTQPQFQQPVPVPAPVATNASGRPSVRQMLTSNPVLLGIPSALPTMNPMMQNGYPQPMMPVMQPPRTPGWAAPQQPMMQQPMMGYPQQGYYPQQQVPQQPLFDAYGNRVA